MTTYSVLYALYDGSYAALDSSHNLEESKVDSWIKTYMNTSNFNGIKVIDFKTKEAVLYINRTAHLPLDWSFSRIINNKYILTRVIYEL
jgi:hypothetical protein